MSDSFRRIASIVLIGTPVPKGRPRVTARGGVPRTYTPKKTRAYEARLAIAARARCPNGPTDKPVSVFISADFPFPQSWPRWKRELAMEGGVAHATKPDLDNLIKCVDALNGIVWKDDSQIVEIWAVKNFCSRHRGALRIEVDEVPVLPAQSARRKP